MALADKKRVLAGGIWLGPGPGLTLRVLELLGSSDGLRTAASLSRRRSLQSNGRQWRRSPPHLTGTPSFSNLHITPPSQPASFVSISFFLLMSWKNNNKKKREEGGNRREAFTTPLATHKGCWSGVYRSCPNLAKLKQRGVSRHVINPPKTSRSSFHRQSQHIKRKIKNTNGRHRGECGGVEEGRKEEGENLSQPGERKGRRSVLEQRERRPGHPARSKPSIIFFFKSCKSL